MKKLWATVCALGALVRRETFHAMEGLTVLAIFGVGMYVAYWLVRGGISDPHRIRVVDLLRTINDNWKAVLLLGIPLFYRTIRAFMERVRKVGGVETSRPADETEPTAIPPSVVVQ